MYDTIELGYGILRIFSEHGNAARAAGWTDRGGFLIRGNPTVDPNRPRLMIVRDSAGREFASIADAAKAHGLSRGHVHRALKGRATNGKAIDSAGGIRFAHIGDPHRRTG